MSWPVHPGKAVGPIEIGAPRTDIREMLGPPRELRGDRPTVDRYPGVVVESGADDRVTSVEVFPELDPELDGYHLLKLPYVEVAEILRTLDPRTVVRSDGAWADGVGVAAQGGVHDPFQPGDSLLVSRPGDEIALQEPPPSRVLVRGWGFRELERALDASGWSVEILDRTAPLVAGEPDVVVARRGDDRLVATLDPVAAVRTLDLTRCSPEGAADVARTVPRWAPVDAAAMLVRPADADEIYRGLVLAEQLDDRMLSEHVERYVDHPRQIIADAARRALTELS